VPELRDRLQSALSGSYRIERELGAGMSRVFVAEDVRLGRPVVIKVLPAEFAAGVNVDRFEREVRLAARLQHPHIVPLLAAGSAGDIPYYVMPFVEGESLRSRLAREGELPVGEVVRLLREVLDALDYAHRHGVVHRDIKPDNVLLTERHAVVTDFGVAKAVSEATGEARLTSTGIALGTPAYMAPEQIAGEPTVDHRADIYAVGALAFEMATGLPPFRGATTQAVLAAHMTQSAPSLTTLRQAITPALDTIVLRCLEKRPADRWQSAAEILPHLDAIAGAPSSVSIAAPARVAPNAQHHPVRIAALFGLASLAVLTLVWELVQRLGLPDWVWQGAIALLVIGLPIMLLTSRRERQRAAAGVVTPSGIGRLFTWRRSIQGGVLGFAALGLAATGFMTSRALGVGPGATLVSAGVLAPRDRIIIADFDNRTADSTLGLTITQLLRIDLAQSPSISVMEPSQVSEVLARMQRDRSTVVTPDVASEVAKREGVKAYLAGEVLSAGAEFVILAKLVSAATGDALVSLRQAVSSTDELMAAVDKLSGKLREEIGESLRSVRADPPLEQVTTRSLSALRMYVEAVRVHDREGPDRAITLLERAIAEDSNFAMAWRRLGAWATNPSSGPRVRAKGDSALRRAYVLRAQLPERERLAVEGSYHMVIDVDLERTAAAYASLLDKYPNDGIALNNIGVAYDRLGRSADALTMYRRSIAQGSALALTYINAILGAGLLGRLSVGDSVLQEFARDMPESGYLAESAILLASHRQDFHAVDSMARVMIRRTPLEQFIGYQYLSMIAELEGRMRDASREMRNALRVQQTRGQLGSADVALLAQVEDVRQNADYSSDPNAQLRRLRALWEQNRALTADRMPLERRHDVFAQIFAQHGDPQQARALMDEFARDMSRSQYPAIGARTKMQVIIAGIANAAGRPDEALVTIRDGCSLAPQPFALCERMAFLQVAQAHDRAGRVDSAIAGYRRFVELRAARAIDWPRALDIATPKIAPAWRRLGELYESKGDRSSAIEAYERFMDFWRNADPELQPIVRAVRERTNSLRRVTG
jgi:eukaryotic-like serine/threonine-protein kinase